MRMVDAVGMHAWRESLGLTSGQADARPGRTPGTFGRHEAGAPQGAAPAARPAEAMGGRGRAFRPEIQSGYCASACN
jgi:hypothetical protein